MKYGVRNPTMTKVFYKFLLKHRILCSWLENVKTQHPNSKGVPQYNENHDILQLLDTCYNIDNSFLWSATPQGHDYWLDLNERLMSEVRKTNYDIVQMGKIPL